MTILDREPPENLRRFTRDEYYRMWEQGLFANERVELVDGEILAMSPQKDAHASTLVLLTHLFVKAVPDQLKVRIQMPLSISDESEPEPDLAIVSDEPGVKRGEHPCTARLVVEVADSSVRVDQRKANLYASGAVTEYWIVDVREKRVHVHRAPMTDHRVKFGAAYREVRVLGLGESITPIGFSMGEINVSTLFPTR